MKLSKSAKSQKKLPLKFIIPIAVLVAAGLVYFFVQAQQQNNTAVPDNSSPEATNNNKVTDKPTEGLPSDSSNTTTDQIPSSEALSVDITSFTQSSGLVEAIASTNNSGTCVFTFKPADSGKPVTKQIVVENKSCKVSIPENEFAYIGQWSLTVTFYNNSEKSEVQKNVSIN